MAFKHISANRLSFLLTSDGAPSGLTIHGEDIPVGSLSIDRIAGSLYQLKSNLTWQPVAGGGGGSTTEIFEELTTASTSAPYVFNLGFNPVANSVKVFVNGILAYPSPATDYDYTVSGVSITWSMSSEYQLDPLDNLVAYYDTTDI